MNPDDKVRYTAEAYRIFSGPATQHLPSLGTVTETRKAIQGGQAVRVV